MQINEGDAGNERDTRELRAEEFNSRFISDSSDEPEARTDALMSVSHVNAGF